MSNQKGERMKNNKLIIPIFYAVCDLSLSFMIFSLCSTAPTNTDTEFVPPEFDVDAFSGNPDAPKEYGLSEIFNML